MHHAFKEWAVICQLLAEGWQTLILRKGGIAERSLGFQVEHERFWLFPTWVHQQSQSVVPAALPVLEKVLGSQPPNGTITFTHFAEVVEVQRLTSEHQALGLGGQHFWTDETVRERFHYRQPGLFALVVRVYAVPRPVALPNTPTYDGCRSWVRLERDLPTDGAAAVLTDAEFSQRRALIAAALAAERGASAP
jgi:hypothetical protein